MNAVSSKSFMPRSAVFTCTVHGVRVCEYCIGIHCQNHEECWIMNLSSKEYQKSKPNDFSVNAESVQDLNHNKDDTRYCHICLGTHSENPGFNKLYNERSGITFDEQTISVSTKITENEFAEEIIQSQRSQAAYRVTKLENIGATNNATVDDGVGNDYGSETSPVKKYNLRNRKEKVGEKSFSEQKIESDSSKEPQQENLKHTVVLSETPSRLKKIHSEVETLKKKVRFLGIRNSFESSHDKNKGNTLSAPETVIHNRELQCLLHSCEIKLQSLQCLHTLNDSYSLVISDLCRLISQATEMVKTVVHTVNQTGRVAGIFESDATSFESTITMLRSNLKCILQLEESLFHCVSADQHQKESTVHKDTVDVQIEKSKLGSNLFMFVLGFCFSLIAYMFIFM